MTHVTVISAVELTAAQKTAVKKTAAQKLGSSKFELIEKVDESILGGVMLQIGSRMYDASLRTQLNALRN